MRLPQRLPQLYRILVLAGIVALLHLQVNRLERVKAQRPVAASEVAEFFPEQAKLSIGRPETETSPPSAPILDGEGEEIGRVIQTSPLADHITGYVGPTNLLLVFDDGGRNLGARIRRSSDTRDHVRQIVEDEAFLQAYAGKSIDEIASLDRIDAVSGATLTSFAIREGVAFALGGQAASLRFPDPITLREAAQLLPGATGISPLQDGRNALQALDSEGTVLGLVLRTGGAADRIPGYRGPTEALLALSPEGDRLLAVRMRGSYETLEYAQDVRADSGFFEGLADIPVEDWLGSPTPGDLGVEGISGATLTSYALAEGVQQTLRDFTEAGRSMRSIHLTATDGILMAFLLVALLLAFTRLRRRRFVVLSFQVATILYLGFLGGHMLAQALLVGWTIHGLPATTAAGLVALAAAAFLVPALSGRNIYCQHLCPHGAAQQLLRKVSKRRIAFPSKLGLLPGALLVLIVVLSLLGKSLNLAALEPFDAYLFPAAGIATVLLFVLGLGASVFQPMAYCKFGCPTGRLLEFVRYRKRGEGWGRQEAVATALLLLALGIYLTGG